jgi:hypothetical protein
LLRATLLPLAVLVGCGVGDGGDDGNRRIVTVWTDAPELAAYVEAFNVVSSTWKVELVFVDRQDVALASTTAPPDLAFGRWLNSPRLLGDLLAFDPLFRDGTLSEQSFYGELLRLGKLEGRQLAIPFSFNLPVIVYRGADQPADLDRFVMDVDTLRALGSEYVAGSSTGLTRIGFSPLWDPDFMIYIAAIRGAGLIADAEGALVVDAPALSGVTALAREWVATSHGGSERDRGFVAAFFHQPMYQLIIDGRIRFYLADLATYFGIPDEKRQQLDFRWLAVDEVIPVSEDVRWFAQPTGGGNGAGVREFLTWILDAEVQQLLLRQAQFKRLRVFGLTDGLSALREVNERVMPLFHEFLIGRLPSELQLRFLGPVPTDWERLKEDVVAPWLLGAADAEPPPQGDLETAAARWQGELRLD